MKSIVRKRLVALLSAAGLAGSAASSAAQVLKGSQPEPNTKTESTIKGQKSTQENKATKDAATIKLRKAGGEQQANKDVVTEKVGADHIVHKHIAGVKYEKSQAASHADAASKDAAKMTKSTKERTAAHTNGHIKGEKGVAESNATKNATWVKGGKTAANTNAAQGEAAQKSAPTTPK
jgi:hypothetical protein